MNRKKKTNFKPFVIIFVLIISLIIGIQLFGAARFETVLASQGKVIDGFLSEVLIIRDEQLIDSPVSGRVKLLVGEGDRLAAGKKLAEINSSSQKQIIYNKKAGIVSFAFDGLEKELNIDNLNQINLNKFDEYKGEYQHFLSGDKIKKNQVLYRVINNFKLYLITKVPQNYEDSFRVNEVIFLEQKNSEKLFKAKIVDIRHNLKDTFFYIKMDQFVPKWTNRRRIDLNIIKNIYRGIKIPRKAVFNQPSGRGVLKVSGYNKFEFQEITILNGNEKYVIVEGLEIGEEIITNPEDFSYGREA